MTSAAIMLLIMTSLWTGAYIFAIVYALRNKTHAIPPISLAFNFAWELVAMFFYFEYVAIVWVITDIIIVFLFAKEYMAKKDKDGFLYIIPFVFWAILCILLFNVQIPEKFNGLYFLGFAQDLFMAIEFNYEFKKKEKDKKIDLILWFVALFKLLGDLLAFISSRMFPSVTFFGILVLIFNTVYILRVSQVLFGFPPKKVPEKKAGKNKKKAKKRKKR